MREQLKCEACLTVEIPETVILPDGTAAVVRAVTARVVEGQPRHIVYTVEKDNGAWVEIRREDVETQNLQAGR